ncbi:MAG: hypothetical protein HY898_13775 [Deltaproteobacteria bacterium]|nr:hypothetical protein [Deltaproteobacteria bacterium]
MLTSYGKLLDQMADAADKQSGTNLLDNGYTLSLAETALDVAESMVFDLNVVTSQRYEDFYGEIERFRDALRALACRAATLKTGEEVSRPGAPEGAEVSASALAEAIGRAHVLVAGAGMAACRGVASGPLFRISSDRDLASAPEGAVLLARDLTPEQEVVGVVRKASAILTESGEAAGEVAKLAREFRIPTIVAMGDAAAGLPAGGVVTVDADECVVYEGRIHELVDYYRLGRIGADEEPEYTFLRDVRQLLFTLTPVDSAEPCAERGRCVSLHDLCHLAHELAGEALAEQSEDRFNQRGIARPVATSAPYSVSVVILGEPSPSEDASGGRAPSADSTTLQPFLLGLESGSRAGRCQGGGGKQRSVMATVKDDHANIIVQRVAGFDMVDALASASPEYNHAYCRFSPQSGAPGQPGLRGDIAQAALRRLGFSVAGTPRSATGWIGNLQRAELQERLNVIGCLSACLDGMVKEVSGGAGIDRCVSTFLQQHA